MRSPSFILFLSLAVLIAGFVGALAYWTFQPPQSPVKDSPSAEELSLVPIPPSRPVIASSDPIRGDAAAPLALIEFGDFLCAPCAEVESTLNSLLEQYKGRVKLVWKDFPNTRLHPLAQKAAQAARCAGAQVKFWQYHDKLFEQTNQGQSLTEQGLSLVARQLNLNMGAFATCLDSGEMSAAVERSFNEGLLLRVDATPYFFIGDRRFSGAITEDELRNIIESYAQPQK